MQTGFGVLALGVSVVILVVVSGGAVKRSELLMPWYEVASDGDGLGPESVNMWKVPPHASFVHPNSFQDPTKWNGDHVLNGGNKEWAEEDGALHAYNMENWRNKILETQLQRQRQQYKLMNTGGPPNAGALKSKSGQSLRQLQAQSSSHVSQSTVAAAAAAAAAATEKQDLGAMVKQLSAALIHPKNAELPEGRGARNRGEIGGGRSATKELVKLEEGNQRLLRRVLRQLRHRRSHSRDSTYRRSYMEGLEKSNEQALSGISLRLAALSREAHHS
mmetsp:Transcript_32618/g.52523  ORF Transcript_32618/g.52523 Transcript_32618/m.52523 type:complete len:275 (+) Transcript_32618:3-827(+)